MLKLVALLATVVLAVGAVMLLLAPDALAPDAPPRPDVAASPSAAPTPSATTAPTATQTATPSPSASAAPLPAVDPAAFRMTTRPLLDASGDWAFIVQRGFGPTEPVDISDTIIAVRLGDGRSTAVATMRFGSRTVGPAALSRALDEQFAPDGRQLVLSASETVGAGEERARLVILELATGTLRRLPADPRYDDLSPRWSPDGRRIAFLRHEVGVGDAGLWTIEVSGGDLRQVLIPPPRPSNSLLYGWTADSNGLAFDQGFEDAFYRVLDLRSGRVSAFTGQTSGVGAGAWRSADPAFVGAFGGAKGGAQSIEVASGPGAAQRELVRQPGPNAFYLAPRWRPGGDDIVFVLTTYGEASARSRLFVVVPPGAPRQLADRQGQMHARWTPDGSGIAYLDVPAGVSATLQVLRFDGTGDRAIFSTGGAPEGRILYPDFSVRRIR